MGLFSANCERLRQPVPAHRLDDPLAVNITLAEKSCECQRSRHHPGHQSCDQSPKYAVRISHHDGCGHQRGGTW